jgi:3-phenylpropionate/trans-cinnamate dioxygenase ferredoxin reductase component
LVLFEDGTVISYDKCLLATGGTPRVLPQAKGVPNVSTYRTVSKFLMNA